MKHQFAALLTFFVLAIAHADENSDMKAKQFVISVPAFKQNGVGLDASVNNAVHAYYDAVDEILRQMRQENLSNEGKVYCAYLLGELRAAKAISILLKNIDLKAEKIDPKIAGVRWNVYPAQDALAKIGMPAVHMILDRLGKEENEDRRKLMCRVIAKVEGKEIGKGRVTIAKEKASDETAKRNLELAAKLFE